ncbi:MAG: hypothetical protein JW976_15475 [Syntrophaceae bacterium]|nr:hypothetical protein [Syntrophaceae bacterium]
MKLKKQGGLAKIIWILLLGLIIVFSVPAIKIVSVHINARRIASVMKNLEDDAFFRVYALSGAENIKKELLLRFDLEGVPEVTSDEITVTEADDVFDVRVTHHYEVKIIMDKYFTLDIDESGYVPIKQ